MTKTKNAKTQAPAATKAVAAKPAVKYRQKHEGTMALWIMTPFGILMPSAKPKHLIRKGDKRTLQVRARERAYLDQFRVQYCPELGKAVHFPTHDYPWKAYVTPEDLAKGVARMCLDIDSEVFKPLAERGGLPPKLGKRLHDCYTSLWSTQLRYGDGTSSYDKWGTSTWVSDPKTHKPDPKQCKRLGHYWPKGRNKCIDCKAPRPAGIKGVGVSDPKTGDVHTQAEPVKPSYDYTSGGYYKGGSSLSTWDAGTQTWNKGPASSPAEPNYNYEPCTECDKGFITADELWVPHQEYCSRADKELCPECFNEPHELGCILDPEAWGHQNYNAQDADYWSNSTCPQGSLTMAGSKHNPHSPGGFVPNRKTPSGLPGLRQLGPVGGPREWENMSKQQRYQYATQGSGPPHAEPGRAQPQRRAHHGQGGGPARPEPVHGQHGLQPAGQAGGHRPAVRHARHV